MRLTSSALIVVEIILVAFAIFLIVKAIKKYVKTNVKCDGETTATIVEVVPTKFRPYYWINIDALNISFKYEIDGEEYYGNEFVSCKDVISKGMKVPVKYVKSKPDKAFYDLKYQRKSNNTMVGIMLSAGILFLIIGVLISIPDVISLIEMIRG